MKGNLNDSYPWNYDKNEMERCENDLNYFYDEYYSKINPKISLNDFNEHISTIKNIKTAIFTWCLGRIKRK